MTLGRMGTTVCALTLLLAFAAPAHSFPPVGEMDESWYEGVWFTSIVENCYRHTDGKPVDLQLELLYMVLRWCGDDGDDGENSRPKQCQSRQYYAEFYTDAKLTNRVGGATFDFDYPSPDVETYLLDGRGGKEVSIRSRFWGECEFEFQGVLTTLVNLANKGIGEEILDLRRGSAIFGWNIAWCDQFTDGGGEKPSADGGGGPVIGHKCRSLWNAVWIDPLPPDQVTQ